MSSSVILSNSVLCAIAAVFLLPLMRNPNVLTLKKGIPVFGAVILVLIKMLVPYEFSFTHTIPSQNILPVIKAIENISIFGKITIGSILFFLWIFIAVLFLFLLFRKHSKLKSILDLVPETKESEILQQVTILCQQNQIKAKPKIIRLEINTSPFIVGLRNPILVLPYSQFTKDEISFILQHELVHLKNNHILIKMCLEVVTAIYWWNPVIWIIRKQVICALESQADAYVIGDLSSKESLSYLETLLQLCKEKTKKDTSLALSFSLTNSMIERRILTALKHNCFQDKPRISLSYILPTILSVVLLLSSFTYTFEACKRNPSDIEGTFTADSESDFLILRNDGKYDLYIEHEYVATVTSIPDDFSDLPIQGGY